MAPHYVRPDLPVAPSVSSGIGQEADTQAQASDAAPMAWKDYFTDARLRAVIGLSLENNRDLRVAVAHIAQARARYKVQGADLFPTISAGASGDIAQVPSGLSGLTGAAEVRRAVRPTAPATTSIAGNWGSRPGRSTCLAACAT
jgi:multidrug efflux system outer membrane protein